MRINRVVSTEMIPPPATKRPKPPPPPSGWPSRETIARRLAQDVPMAAYDLPLRPNLLVRVTLPRDVTLEEVERLCTILRTLPVPPTTEEKP